MKQMSVVLGVDGGGTNTRAAIVSDGKILASGHSGSIKRLRVGAEAAEANLRAVLKDVFAKAGVKSVNAASCGVASASMPGITEWITAVFNDFGVERSEVVGDEVIALDAAFQGGPGILQIAGKGSNTIGRARWKPRIRGRMELASWGSGLWLLDRCALNPPRAYGLRSRGTHRRSEESECDMGHSHHGRLH
jgi:N-acetylglucosamine kinase-like BadF-type ATPase